MRPWRRLCEHIQKENICTAVGPSGRGLTRSQDISLYPSVYAGVSDVSSISGDDVGEREEPRHAGVESEGEEEDRGRGEMEANGNGSGKVEGDDEGRLEGRGGMGRGEAEDTGERRGEIGGDAEMNKESEEGFLSLHSRGGEKPAASMRIPQTNSHSTARDIVSSSTNRSEVGVGGASGRGPTGGGVSADSSVSDHSNHGKVVDLSSLLSSMSIDDSDHMNTAADSRKSLPGEEDSAHLSNGAGSTHLSGPSHLSNGAGSTHPSGSSHLSNGASSSHLSNGASFAHPSGSSHLSNGASSSHLSNGASSTHPSGSSHLSNGASSSHLSNGASSTHPSGSSHLSNGASFTHPSGSSRLSNGADLVHPSNVAGSTHFSGPSHLSNGAGSAAHLSNVMDSTHSYNDPNAAHLSEDSDATHLSEDSDATHLSEDTDSTHLSGETRHEDHTHLSSLKVAHDSNQLLVKDAASKSQRETGQCGDAIPREGLQGYSDELDSDMTELRLCEVRLGSGKVSNPMEASPGRRGEGINPSQWGSVGSGRVSNPTEASPRRMGGEGMNPCSDTALACEGRLFQPPSFSTPFRKDSSDRRTTGEWGNFPRLDSDSNEIGLLQTGSRHSTQFQSNSTPKSSELCTPGSMGYDSSRTRLESFWGKIDSPMDLGMTRIPPGATPCAVTPYVVLQPSAKKSILKKRRSYSDGGGSPSLRAPSTARKNLSKSVTFKLPSESCSSEGSLVLAVETPEHLWCTPLGWDRKPSAATRPLCTHETSFAPDEVTTPPPDGSSSVQSMDVSIDSSSCVSRDDSHMECSTLPPAANEHCGCHGNSNHGDGWTLPPAVMEVKHRGCHSNSNHDDAWTPPRATSIGDSEESGVEEGMSVLAVQTPVEFWESVPVNFINNTFNS